MGKLSPAHLGVTQVDVVCVNGSGTQGVVPDEGILEITSILMLFLRSFKQRPCIACILQTLTRIQTLLSL